MASSSSSVFSVVALCDLPPKEPIVYTYRLRQVVQPTPEVSFFQIRREGARPKHGRTCAGMMGRGQAVRRGTLDPVFEGSNPSAPAKSRGCR